MKDPTYPHTREFTSWQDFVDRVARPMVEADGETDQELEAMALFKKASPYFICVSMVMMDNRIKKIEEIADDLEAPW